MIYKVVRHFSDLLDGSYKYAEGDVYPREGYTPSEKRIAELASENNKQKTVLIQAIVDEAESAETVETSAVEETEPTTTITEEIKVIEEEKPKKRSRSKKTEE